MNESQRRVNTSHANQNESLPSVEQPTKVDAERDPEEAKEEQKQEDSIRVGQVCVPIKKSFYLEDTTLIDDNLKRKLLHACLEGSFIMIRAKKIKLFDTEKQKRLGQAKIMGVILVDSLIELCSR